LTEDLVKDLVEDFFSAITEHDPNQERHARRKINSVLGELWEFGVKPVLDELGFTQMPPPGRSGPRVWWVGSGLLNVLPIPAAGYHDSDPPQTVLDHVVSSYTFIVKSLSYARERAAKAAQVPNAILFSMPTTPNETPLPFVETEIGAIKQLLENSSIPTTIQVNPLRVDALSKLPIYAIAHFACHGSSESDPSRSNLLLEDLETKPLTVLDFVSLNIESARFAYLSACHTSAMKNIRLLDESINLSAAIQLSGYPSVVGSLWQVKDTCSAEIAKDVYEWILRDSNFDPERSAEGLHKAVHQLQERTRIMNKHDPLAWTSFIHVGI